MSDSLIKVFLILWHSFLIHPYTCKHTTTYTCQHLIIAANTQQSNLLTNNYTPANTHPHNLPTQPCTPAIMQPPTHNCTSFSTELYSSNHTTALHMLKCNCTHANTQACTHTNTKQRYTGQYTTICKLINIHVIQLLTHTCQCATTMYTYQHKKNSAQMLNNHISTITKL